MKNKISLHPSDVKKRKILTYNFNGLKISFCTPPDQKGRIRCLFYFDGCREGVASFLRTQIEEDDRNSYKNKIKIKRDVEIDLKRVRLILFLKANDKNAKSTIERFGERKDKEVAIGLKLVNHYEKRLGWLLTKITKLQNGDILKDVDIKNTINMYMVVGSSKWLRSPYMLSLYMLLLRLGTRGFKGNFETHEELFKEFETFVNKNNGHYKDANHINYKDANHIKKKYPMWDILLENHSKFFRDKSINRLYNRKYLVNGGSGFNEGITKLCSGYSLDLEMNKKFVELCKNNGIHTECKVKVKDAKDTGRVSFY